MARLNEDQPGDCADDVLEARMSDSEIVSRCWLTREQSSSAFLLKTAR